MLVGFIETQYYRYIWTLNKCLQFELLRATYKVTALFMNSMNNSFSDSYNKISVDGRNWRSVLSRGKYWVLL